MYKREAKRTKNEYWNEKFKKADSSRDMWSLTNYKLNRSQKTQDIGPLVNSEGNLIEEPLGSANLLNTFSSEIGSKTAESIPQSKHSYIPTATKNSFLNFEIKNIADLSLMIN